MFSHQPAAGPSPFLSSGSKIYEPRPVKRAGNFYDEKFPKQNASVLMSKMLDTIMLWRFCTWYLTRLTLQYQVNSKKENVFPPAEELKDLVTYTESHVIELLIRTVNIFVEEIVWKNSGYPKPQAFGNLGTSSRREECPVFSQIPSRRFLPTVTNSKCSWE